MAELTISAKKREISTKGYLNELRREGNVPGTVYGKDGEALSVYAPEVNLNKLIYTKKTHVINLEVEGGETYKCVMQDKQFDPITDKLIHFDLIRFTETDFVKIAVPLVLTGAAEGVRKGGKLRQSLHKIKIECLPADVPEEIKLDVSHMELNTSYLMRDVKLEKYKILSPSDTLIAVVSGSRNTADEAESE